MLDTIVSLCFSIHYHLIFIRISCSVACYKKHKTSALENNGCVAAVTQTSTLSLDSTINDIVPRDEIQAEKQWTDPTVISETTPLRPLTSLKWPYIAGEEPAYPDPLERNDPKPLRTRHYEAIGELLQPSIVSI